MGGWNAASHGWHRARRTRRHELSEGGRWTLPDVAALLVAFAIRWELGLAFLALKLWHQTSGSPLSTLAFARAKWDGLVAIARGLTAGRSLPFTIHVGPQSSGNAAFDLWRRDELARLDAERGKLASAERDFARYRDELLHAKDREDFDRFMRGQSASRHVDGRVG